MSDVYLDIETDGGDLITVIGFVAEGSDPVQLADEEVSSSELLRRLPASGRIFTFNGERFDLPKIREGLGVDLLDQFESCDLMKVGWAHDLAGGQKAIEDQLGFNRSLPGMGGLDAIRLWDEYAAGSNVSLETLLAYNAEDLDGMRFIRAHLETLCCLETHGDRNRRWPKRPTQKEMAAT